MNANRIESQMPPAISKRRLLLFILAAVQFVHVMNFMFVMPLGAQLMREFDIGPSEFSKLMAAYSIPAAVMGFLAGFVMDRIPRREALLVLFAGFVISTLGCAFSPNYFWLFLTRALAGIFGGVASSVGSAMVADVFPPARRGQAMAVIGAAFPIAMVMGLPVGLSLADAFGWHAPFLFLGVASVIVLAVAFRILPPVPSVRTTTSPTRQMWEILTHPVHIRAFLLSGVLVFAGAMIVPFMAPSMQENVLLTSKQIALMYFCGGVVTFFTTNLFGKLSDKYDKLYVLSGITIFVIIAVVFLTRLGPSPLWLVLCLTTLFFVTMSGRFAPAMALVANAVEAKYRGGFMSVNTAMQQACGGFANIVAGWVVVKNTDTGFLENYDTLGLFSAVIFVVTVLLAAWLRAAVPEAAKNPRRAR